jgi:predicted neutral ceramidase superfamily lipid hydrolase
MVNQKLIVVAYIFAFFSVYLGSIAYAMVPLVVEEADMPQTAFTYSVSSSISSFNLDRQTLLALFCLIIVAVIIVIIGSSISTFRAY